MAQYLQLNPKLFAVDFVGEQDLLHAVTTLIVCDHPHRFFVRKDTRQLLNLSWTAVSELGGDSIPGASRIWKQGSE